MRGEYFTDTHRFSSEASRKFKEQNHKEKVLKEKSDKIQRRLLN